MIASLKGKILSKGADGVIVDVGGVGYHVNVPLGSLSNLPDRGSETFLNIHTHVREDAIQLYGFTTEEEKKIFTILINISGIGPKIAMSVLSAIPPDKFHAAITSEDVDALCSVPGLGKKTAHRIILELREKLPALIKGKTDVVYDDTLSALINLGYKRNIAQDALEKAQNKGCANIESLLKEALRYLTKE
ncbi:MAG: Holliday junction branch migration protein RuvA [Nitrospirae bacterium]|nr:Holliday junction branch migration protein RuvA [Nitrospirota bacterium]